MSISKNLIAGLANSLWSAILGFSTVPFYIKYLGIESYGLIGFFGTMLAVINLLDMGIASSVNREVARCSVTGNFQEAGKMLHTLAVVYWGLAGAIFLLVYALAPLIASYWLQSKQQSPQTISYAVMLMGLVIACRWPIGLYQGALIGAQRLVLSSSISMIMTSISTLGAVAVLAFISATIEAFFIWQAFVGLVYAVTMRLGAWRIIGRIRGNHFDINLLKKIWRFTAGMTAIGLSGILLSHLDKIILSKILNLEEFGSYMLATVLVSGMFVLITPVFNVIYPRFSAYVASKNILSLIELYRIGTRLLASILFPIAMFLVVFGKSFVLIWTGNQIIATNAAPIIALLAIGTALHGMMYFPYSLQLAYGDTRLTLYINIVLMIFLVPLIVFFSLFYGALGGAMAWLALNVIYMMIGTWLTNRKLLNGIHVKWLVVDVGIPLALSTFIGLALHTNKYSLSSDYSNIVFGLIIALLTSIISVLATPKLRLLVIKNIRSKI